MLAIRAYRAHFCRYQIARLYSSVSKAKEASHKYADTICLPKTDFPNRSGSGEQIQKLIQRSSDEIYQWQIKSDSFKEKSVFHDGPPYANASLHLGHAMNKILKDIINRYALLQGKKIDYRPGWDCHGLPIELKALQTLSQKAKKDVATVLSPTEIRSIARNHALEAIEDQMKSFKTFAVMADWDNRYQTLNTDYEVRQLEVFKEMMQRGLITRKNKPVYWGTETRTALAEAELEYNDKHKSTAVVIKFPITEIGPPLLDALKNKLEPGTQLGALIWTTTPWTLVSNKAIAVSAEMDYSIVHHEQHGYLVVGEPLRESLGPDFQKVDSISFKGADILDSKYTNALFPSSPSPFLAASYVTATMGTGLVHTAPGHGFDDYLLCSKHNIDTYSPVDNEGKYTSEVPPELSHLKGLYVLNEGQKEIIKLLQEKNIIVSMNKNYRHKYPYDWRSKKPVIIRSTAQWFADIGSIKSDAISSLEDVVFYPETGRNRLEAFVTSRSEWCISRQRVWGVPIPAIYDKDTNEPVLDVETINHVIAQIEKYGTDAWFEPEEDIQKWLPHTTEFANTGKKYIKGKDTMDVWFDSGTSWTLLEERKNDYLADFYLEGSDQHRGWFQSSLLTKMSVSKPGDKRAPFKHVITHGFTLDEKGQKMSKSLGNTIVPDKVIDGQKGKWPPLGVDGLRLWVASSDYTKDVTAGPTVLKTVAESLKKLRITIKFLLGSLKDYNGDFSYQPEKLQLVDKMALHQLKAMADQTKEQYESFCFNRVVQIVNNHTSAALSSFYFDIIKDRLYSSLPHSDERRAVQFVLAEILKVYLSVLSPITPLLTQQAWDYAPEFIRSNVDSPFKLGWADLPAEYHNTSLEKEIALVEKITSVAKQAMEMGRSNKHITGSLGCDINLYFEKSDNDVARFIENHSQSLADFFICSHVHINPKKSTHVWSYKSSGEIDGIKIHAEAVPSLLHKCPRCWKFDAEAEESLCKRCNDVVSHM